MVRFYNNPHKRISTSCCPNMIQLYILHSVLVSTATVFNTNKRLCAHVFKYLQIPTGQNTPVIVTV